MRWLILFTDLDGTLLDARTYSAECASPALAALSRRGIPLVLCSSKTRREIESWRLRLGNRDPFVSENGGAIFIPRGTFPPERIRSTSHVREEADGFSVQLGASYAELREAMARLRAMGWAVRGFGDMTVEEVEAITGLTAEEAAMAKAREHDEPFVVDGPPADVAALRESIAHIGLRLTEGRFYHLLGNSDKGRAVSILLDLYSLDGGPWISAALGDSPNDIEMLSRVDRAIVVQGASGEWDSRIDLPGLIRAPGVGPIGWNRAVLDLLEKLPEEV